MDEEVYHFEKDIMSLDDIKKNEECSFINDQKETAHKTINYENELENSRNECITETSIPESHLKSRECDKDGNVIISSTTLLHPVSLETNKSKLESESKYEVHSHALQAEHILPMVEIKPEPFKGSCRLVRLQADTNSHIQSVTSVARDVGMSNENSSNISSENSSEKMCPKEMVETTSQPVVCSESDYQFLTPRILSTRQQAFVSTNSQIPGTNFTPLLQSVCPNSSGTPISTYEPVSLSKFGVSQTDNPVLRYDKVRSRTSNDVKSPMWIVNSSSSSDSNTGSIRMNNDSSLQYSVNETQESSPEFQSVTNIGESPPSQQIQRFITADSQIVYGYKDANGEFHFFSPNMNDRESHNEKERKRRSRVSEACSALRKIIPGATDKTDKASVFELAASYLKFLREKFGMQFDQAYCEKYFQDRA